MSEPAGAADVPRRHQELVTGCILLLLAERRSHGYELHERVKEMMPLWDVRVGHVYRELHKMDAEGLVAAVCEASQARGPARRIYEITGAGRHALDEWILGVRGLVRMLENCIASHEDLAPRQPPRR